MSQLEIKAAAARSAGQRTLGRQPAEGGDRPSVCTRAPTCYCWTSRRAGSTSARRPRSIAAWASWPPRANPSFSSVRTCPSCWPCATAWASCRAGRLRERSTGQLLDRRGGDGLRDRRGRTVSASPRLSKAIAPRHSTAAPPGRLVARRAGAAAGACRRDRRSSPRPTI